MPERKSTLLDKWRKVAKHLDFYYYEKVGNRYVFRITPFALIFLIVLTIIAFGIAIYMQLIEPSPREINTNITVPSPTPYSANIPLIRMPPPPPSPVQPIKQPKRSMPALPIPPTLDNNANDQLVHKQTPQPSPSESPP